jgi:hypothetical protein
MLLYWCQRGVVLTARQTVKVESVQHHGNKNIVTITPKQGKEETKHYRHQSTTIHHHLSE